MEKRRVYNERKYDIGLVMQNGVERVVHPGSFVLLDQDEIEYAASIAPALFEGEKQLRLEDRSLSVKLGFVQSEHDETLSHEFIRKKLVARNPVIKAWLDSVTEPYLLDVIYDVAVTMDLPASKLLLLRERMPEKEFIATEE